MPGRARSFWIGAAALLAAPAAALAGPPYVTDDPQPTDLGHWEIYNFVDGSRAAGDLSGEFGLDLNYGAAKDAQLTMVVPTAYDNGRDFGAGDLQLAAKYKFLHQSDGSWLPDVAFFPRAFVPTGVRFDPDRPGILLPIWAEKDFGPWSVFGGGGFQWNPGRNQRNFWQGGLVVTRSFGERFSLGGEVYHQTASTRDGRDLTGVNLGGTWKLSDHWALMAAGGPGIQNARQAGQYDFYFALEATY
jgi:hypothetical protein